MADDKQLNIVLTLKSNLNKGIASVDASLERLNKTVSETGRGFQQAGQTLTNFGKGASIRFAGLAASIFGLAKTFGDFEKSMANVSTLVDTSVESMQNMQNEVLAIAKRTPVAIGDLAAALYDVRSAGIEASQAMGVLEASAKLGVAGLGSTAEATNIMTSAMNAFASEGLDATKVSDILFRTVKSGKTTIADLAQAFGSTAPIIQDAGFKLDDFSAATAALTSVGTPAAQVQNQLRAATVALLKPTSEMQKIFKRLGVKDGRELIKTSKGMGDVFQKVKTAAEQEGIELSKVTGRVEAMSAILSLTGQTNKIYTDSLNGMRDGTIEVEKAFQKQKATFASAMQIFKNNFQALAITIGAQLAPAITFMAEKMNMFMAFIQRNPALGKLLASILLIVTAMTGLAAVFGLIGGQVLQGIAVFQKLVAVFKLLKLTTIQLNLAFLANPITWIILGIIAAVALLYAAWKTNFLGIQEITDKVVKFIMRVFETLKIIFKQVWDVIAFGAKFAFDFIKNVVMSFFNLIKPLLDAYLAAWKFIFKIIIAIVTKGFNAILKISQVILGSLTKFASKIGSIILAPFKLLLKAFNFILKKMGKEPINLTKAWQTAGDKISKVSLTPKTTTTGTTTPGTTGTGTGTDTGTGVTDTLTPDPGAVTEAAQSNASAYTSAFVNAVKNNTSVWDALSMTMADQISTGILEFMITPISEGLDFFAQTMVQTFVETFGELLSPITDFIKQGIQAFAGFIKDLLTKFINFGEVFKFISQGIGVVWKFLTNNMVVDWAVAMLSILIDLLKTAVGAVTAFASMAAGAAASAVAGIPFIGPALAVAAFAGTYALVIGGLGKLVGLAEGTPEVIGGAASDTVPAMLTPGEMVVPKSMAQGIRSGDVSLGGGNESGDSESGGRGDTFVFNGDINGVTQELISLLADGLREATSTGLVAPI